MVGVMVFLPLNELPALVPHVVDWISCQKQAATLFDAPVGMMKFLPLHLDREGEPHEVTRILLHLLAGKISSCFFSPLRVLLLKVPIGALKPRFWPDRRERL